jgi:hypothetical protein
MQTFFMRELFEREENNIAGLKFKHLFKASDRMCQKLQHQRNEGEFLVKFCVVGIVWRGKWWLLRFKVETRLYLLVQLPKVPVVEINSSYRNLVVQFSILYSAKKYKTKMFKICLQKFSILLPTNFCTFWSLYQRVLYFVVWCTKKFCTF